MLHLSTKIRDTFGKKVKDLREEGIIPGILYGPEIKEFLMIEVDQKNFEKVYKESGESSLISLGVLDEKSENKAIKEFLVLIHSIERDPLTDNLIHIDFYQPIMGQEIEVMVPLVFEGEAPAVKELGGTLVKNMSELEIKSIPQSLPREIKVPVDVLKTFEDRILVKELVLPKGVKTAKDPEEIVALVVEPEKAEEELEKPIEENVEQVEKITKERAVAEEKEE